MGTDLSMVADPNKWVIKNFLFQAGQYIFNGLSDIPSSFAVYSVETLHGLPFM